MPRATLLRRLAWFTILAMLPGCQQGSGSKQKSSTQPEPNQGKAVMQEEAKTSRPETEPAKPPASRPADPNVCVIKIQDVTDKQTGWLYIEAKDEADQPASAIGRVAGKRKLVVKTENVRYIQINLPKAGMPAKRSVILKIDGQGIEITGRYGPIGRFERSKQGVWEANRKDWTKRRW